MTITPQQKTAITTKLSVNLSTLTDDKLIELCLLYRSAPEAKPTFPDLLETEITRRFTGTEILNNDVMFSVIVNFSNQFNDAYLFSAGQETAISTLLSVDLSLVTDDRLIELCLVHKAAPFVYQDFVGALSTEITRRFTPSEIAANDVIFSVLKKFETAFILLLDPTIGYETTFAKLIAAPDKEQWFIDNTRFMVAVFNSVEPLNYLTNNAELVVYVSSSNTATTQLFAVSAAVNAFVLSTVAMPIIAASTIAMTKIATSSVVLATIAVTTSARNALMGNNSVFQSVRQQIYSTVSANWTRKILTYSYEGANTVHTAINSQVTTPNGYAFGSLGWWNTSTSGQVEAKHPNGTIARQAGTSSNPTTLANLDVVSFNGIKFTSRVSSAQACVELWAPPSL